MEIFFKIAVLLALGAGTSASASPCSVPWEGYLNCSERGLSMPPTGFWPNVTWLDLENNSITELPTNSFTGFPALTQLSLSHNSITRLNFGELETNTDLFSLTITNNQIDTFTPPSREATFEKLQYIYASNNKVSHLDPNFFSFAPNLRCLQLRNNPLIVEAAHPVLNHPRLDWLSMGFGGTDLNVVDSILLAGLPNLQWLDLSSANISSVEGAFANNRNLWHLDLQGNAITQISSGTFHTESKISALNLNRNPLNSLVPAALNNTMSSPGIISIRDTPVACECRYEALFRWAKSKSIALFASCGAARICSFARRS